MKNYPSNSIVLFSLLLLLGACSTVKNTWYTRTHHAISTKYNVFFNGRLSYEEGLRNINIANEDDYTVVIPMYPISKHSNAASATSNMDRTIEKCRKSIKLYSIKKKPAKNAKRWNDSAYQAFYKQTEFNPALKDAWLLLAKAEFHKADFLGSVGTFSYIIRMYGVDKEMVAICQLWMVRAYAEMDWLYEAEQILSTVKQDDLSSSNARLYASVNADFLLKKKRYKDAIPFLELALSKEKDKVLKLRFSFILAQLYQKTGEFKLAYESYTNLLKDNPPFEMDFNARINRAQLNTANIQTVRKDLIKMAADGKNEDYLDQLYYALGNTYLLKNDTAKALENFNLSVEKSKRKGLDMAVTLVTLGDLYYTQKKYILAQPAYDEASKILTKEQSDFKRVTKLAETLSELVVQNDIVLLQDSLQRLALMPEDKRMKVIEKVIERLIQEEKEAAEKEEELLNEAQTETEMGGMMPIGGNRLGDNMGDWYFYNPEIIKSGRASFLKLWGKRKLEDNWRRKNKSSTMMAADNYADAADEVATDSVSDSTVVVEKLSDVKSPSFYLQQIPITKTQLDKSNEELATAMYNLGLIYKDRVEDYPQAVLSFEEFIQRFPADVRVPDALFHLYMLQSKQGNDELSELYRSRLVAEYPKSKYSEILSKPNYVQRMERMYTEQDSLYNISYKSYMSSDFSGVKSNTAYMQQNYPLSTLLPKFLFLKALSVGKTESAENFGLALDELITKYPASDVSALAKDIMTKLKQGEKSVQGKSQGTLLARRDEMPSVVEDTVQGDEQKFSTDKLSKHRILLIGQMNKESQNKLLFEVASFNFNRFLIKDFDLLAYNYDSLQTGLSVLNLESYEEAYWYFNTIQSDSVVSALMKDLNVQIIVVSEQNFTLINRVFSIDEYLDFENKNLKIALVTKDAKKQKAGKSKSNLMTLDAKANASVPIAPESTNEMSDGQLYKNLFVFSPKEPHLVLVSLLSGATDVEKLKAKLQSHLTRNFEKASLTLIQENVGKQIIFKIGNFSDASKAENYYKTLKESSAIFQGIRSSDYQVLIGGTKNINTMLKQNALKVYLEFMQIYYLKNE